MSRCVCACVRVHDALTQRKAHLTSTEIVAFLMCEVCTPEARISRSLQMRKQRQKNRSNNVSTNVVQFAEKTAHTRALHD